MTLRRHPVAVSVRPTDFSRLPIDRELAARLEATYRKVREREQRLAEVFYEKLFTAAPQLRAMFRSDASSQAQKLMASLDAVVQNLSDPESNAGMLMELGNRHAGYGAKPEHYALVTQLLVESMREVLGDAADARSLEEWRTAFTLISRRMMAE